MRRFGGERKDAKRSGTTGSSGKRGVVADTRGISSAMLSSALQQELMGRINVDFSMDGRGGMKKKKKKRREPVDHARAVDSSNLTQPLSLAQRLGIKAMPEKKLSAQQWDVKRQVSFDRGDSHALCPICAEGYKMNDQVLLSCSHLFHARCLSSFENYSDRKTRHCPLCRCANYEKMRITDGNAIYEQKCAVIVQSLCRARAARKLYAVMKRTIPPRNEQLRTKFVINRLEYASQVCI
jgi:hypothetical protein